MVRKILTGAAVVALALSLGIGSEVTAQPGGKVLVKQAIADAMTPAELAAYKERLAERIATRRFDNAAPGPGIQTPADTCVATTPEVATLPFGPVADTTVGQTDNFDLPADTTNPTCAASTTCTGAGPAGSLPRGAIYTGTGTAPDRAYQIQVDVSCTVSITMDPTGAQDLALIVYQSTCSSLLSDCVCVDDTGVGGVAETVTLDAVAGTTYFVVIDGYSTGGTPPGPSGPFTLAITETTATGCDLTPVELQGFSVD